MSERAWRYALGHSDSTGVLRMGLVVLALHADTEGRGRMRRRPFARKVGIDFTQVEPLLAQLQQRGLIEYGDWIRSRTHPTSFGYRVLIPEVYRPELRAPWTERALKAAA